jgi:L-lactate dehydrogenase complex protein LldG
VGERENILARIREALTIPAPRPDAAHGPVENSASATPPEQDIRTWLPPGGKTFEESLELFSRNARDLKAEFELVDTADELLLRVRALMLSEKWTKLATHKGELTDLVVAKLGLPTCLTDSPYDAKELEQCDVGITQCDALVAQTGSVLVTSRSAGGRALSALPPHHVVLARGNQLVPDLVAAFALLKKLYSQSYPSFISFITGPSRTGDIERILVLGAHGPKRLTILCC